MIVVKSSQSYIKSRNTLTLCKCWKIVRQDGKVFSYTDHDAELTIDNVLFKVSNSLDCSAAEKAQGISGINAELQGFISADAFSHEELLAGLYNNASVTQYIVDWKYPFLGYFSKTEYVIVTLTYNSNFWTAEIEGFSNTLKNPVGGICSGLCSHVFGESECGVDVAPYTSQTFFVTDVIQTGYNKRQTFKFTPNTTPGRFNLGTCVFTSGKNNFHKHDISSNKESSIDLFLQTAFDIEEGDSFYLIQGCDRNVESCKTYSNINRFGGYPFVIGKDKMITHPDYKKA